MNHELIIFSVVLEIEIFSVVGTVQANQNIIIATLSCKNKLLVADECFTVFAVLEYTEMFCNLLHLYESGIDISDMFYKTYDDMEKESPYYLYYISNK